MKDTDELFRLVKSLDKSEKRFFKLYAQLHQHNNTPQYVKLFDIYDGMQEYDKVRFKKETENTTFFKNTSQLKLYLRNNILNALKVYHKKNQVEVQDYETWGIIRILQLKNFPELAKKILLRIKIRMLKEENYPHLILINRKLIELNQIIDRSSSDLLSLEEKYHKEILFYLQQLELMTKLNQLITKSKIVSYTKERYQQDFKKTYKNILEKDLTSIDKDLLIGLNNKYMFYSLRLTSNLYLDNLEAALSTVDTLLNIIKQPRFDNNSKAKGSLYLKLLSLYSKSLKKTEFWETEDKLTELINKHPELKPTMQYWKFLSIIDFYSRQPDTPPSSFFDKMKIEIINSENKIPVSQQISLLSNLAVLCFIQENYNLCLDYVFHINKTSKVSYNDPYFFHFHLAEILCYFELRNYKQAKTKVLSLRRKLMYIETEDVVPLQLLSLINSLLSASLSENQAKVHKAYQQINNLIIESNSNLILIKYNIRYLQKWINGKSKVLSVDSSGRINVI